MKEIEVSFRFLRDSGSVRVPAYQTPGASGMDLHASLEEPVTISPGGFAMIPSGIAISIPAGYEAQIRPRSGLAARHGVTVLNAPGTIDSDYRGELCVIMVNFGKECFTINDGDRIAQMIFSQVVTAQLVQRSSLDSTDREAGGFGHTGV
ncbi:MAG: dUTP diphosphatase [Candidatus Xenobiia bacterium LiM19]